MSGTSEQPGSRPASPPAAYRVWGAASGPAYPSRAVASAGPAYCPIGMTNAPAVWVIRLYPPDPGWTSVVLGVNAPRR
jgi:hypothetical protein